MIGRAERVEGFSRKDRKGRKELNHEIHESGGTGCCARSAAILSPLSSIVRPKSLVGGYRRECAIRD